MIREWFNQLSNRDQIAVLILAGVLGFWLLIQLIFVELDGRNQQLLLENSGLRNQLNRVDAKAEQLSSLRSGGMSERVNLIETVSQAGEAQGLVVKRLQPNSRGEVQVRFEGIPFDGLLKFFEQIEGLSGLIVVDASISAAGSGRGVNATLRIAGP